MPTYPGMNQSFDIGLFPPDEQRVIRRFARYFYITRAADAIHIGNSKYRALLMRPSEDLAVVLNVFGIPPGQETVQVVVHVIHDVIAVAEHGGTPNEGVRSQGSGIRGQQSGSSESRMILPPAS